MTFPSSLVHWLWLWLRCPQCLSHPPLKGALKFSFLGSESQEWANPSPRAGQQCLPGLPGRRGAQSWGEHIPPCPELPPAIMDVSYGKTPGHLARTSKAGTKTKETLSHWESIPQQSQFLPKRAVLALQSQFDSLQTQPLPLDPETLKPVPLKQNSRVVHFQRSEFQAERFHNKLPIFQGVQSTTTFTPEE